MWGGISAFAVAAGPSLGRVLIDAGAGLGLLHQPSRPAGRGGGDGADCHRVGGGQPAADLIGVALSPWRWRRSRSGSPRATTGAGRALQCSAAFTAVAPARRLGRPPRPGPPGPRQSTSACSEPHGRPGQRGDGRMRGGLLRHAAGRRPLPHHGLGLLHPQGRPRHHPRSASGGGAEPLKGALAGRIGYRPVLVVQPHIRHRPLWCVAFMQLTPGYLGPLAAGQPPTGVGMALTFAVLSAAAVAGLPAERFGVGRAEPARPPRWAACWAWPCSSRSSAHPPRPGGLTPSRTYG